jgi:hypothetical protein
MATARLGGKLSARRVETAAAGTHEDGSGLRLVVRPSGARSWVLRYQLQGRRRDLGLGRWPEITLARAREKAMDARRLVAEGRDPLAERGRARVLSFKAAAEALVASKAPGWGNAKHAAQWSATLKSYAYPRLGDLDVRQIGTAEVLEVLRPIWTTKILTICCRSHRRCARSSIMPPSTGASCPPS